jgi:phosphohistidine phosphatase
MTADATDATGPSPEPEPAGRTLLLLRHGKTEQGPDLDDVNRTLAPRGRRDAAAVGRWLSDHDLRPDLVACSVALRTRQTWDAVSGALDAGDPPPVDYHERIYNADLDALFQVLRDTPSDVGTLLVVGHNLGMPRLAVALDGQDEAERRLAADGFPTASLAVLRVEPEWSMVEPGTGRLVDYVTRHDGG